jgi:hypothetical protein
MGRFKARRCRECGKGTILPHAKRGRKERYRNLILEVPASFEIPTCDTCHSEWMNESTAAALDKVLEGRFRQELRSRVIDAIQVITQTVSQSRLETLIGLSGGYISKVKCGERDPSPELVSELALLATNPQKGVEALERLWGPLLANEET